MINKNLIMWLIALLLGGTIFTKCGKKNDSSIVNVTKTKINLDNVVFNNKSIPFDGDPHSIQAVLPKDAPYFVTYNDSSKQIGSAQGNQTYTVTATFKLYNYNKFEWDKSLKMNADSTVTKVATLTIVASGSGKTIVSLTNVVFKDTTLIFKDVPSYTLIATNLPAGASVTYANNKVDGAVGKTISSDAVATFTLTDPSKYEWAGNITPNPDNSVTKTAKLTVTYWGWEAAVVPALVLSCTNVNGDGNNPKTPQSTSPCHSVRSSKWYFTVDSTLGRVSGVVSSYDNNVLNAALFLNRLLPKNLTANQISEIANSLWGKSQTQHPPDNPSRTIGIPYDSAGIIKMYVSETTIRTAPGQFGSMRALNRSGMCLGGNATPITDTCLDPVLSPGPSLNLGGNAYPSGHYSNYAVDAVLIQWIMAGTPK